MNRSQVYGMDEVETKFPKQWRHWAKCAGIKPSDRSKHGCHYMKGRGRHWRVSCFGVFECSCPTPFFDRWANSRGAEVPTIPKTKQEFLATVKMLIEQSKDAR